MHLVLLPTWRSRGVDGVAGNRDHERLDPARAVLGLGRHLGRVLPSRSSMRYTSKNAIAPRLMENKMRVNLYLHEKVALAVPGVLDDLEALAVVNVEQPRVLHPGHWPGRRRRGLPRRARGSRDVQEQRRRQHHHLPAATPPASHWFALPRRSSS